MNEIEVREAFAQVTNTVGLVDGKEYRAGNSGNSLLFHSHYVWLMRNAGFWTSRDTAITRGVVGKCQLEPGLFRRAPLGFGFSGDQEGPDDYIGLISMAAADPALPYARDFLAYGRTLRVPIGLAVYFSGHPILAKCFGWFRLSFVFNNKMPRTLLEADDGMPDPKPNWEAWLGRFPAVVAHAQHAAGERPALWRRIWWAGSVWQAARFHDQEGTDEWLLTWHLVQTFRRAGKKSWLCELAAKNFTARLYTKWPAGMNSVLLKYFGADHPLTIYFRA